MKIMAEKEALKAEKVAKKAARNCLMKIERKIRHCAPGPPCTHQNDYFFEPTAKV